MPGFFFFKSLYFTNNLCYFMSIYYKGRWMSINKDTIRYVANLARLEINEASLDKFADQVDEILEYINTLNQVDTSKVQGTSHAIALTNSFREDRVKEHLENSQALSNAPEKEDGTFVVPKIVGR